MSDERDKLVSHLVSNSAAVFTTSDLERVTGVPKRRIREILFDCPEVMISERSGRYIFQGRASSASKQTAESNPFKWGVRFGIPVCAGVAAASIGIASYFVDDAPFREPPAQTRIEESVRIGEHVWEVEKAVASLQSFLDALESGHSSGRYSPATLDSL